MKTIIQKILFFSFFLLSQAMSDTVNLSIDQIYEAEFSGDDTAFILQFETTSNEIYQVETSSNLEDFAPQGNSFIGLGDTMSKIAYGEGRPRAFFRVVIGADPLRLAGMPVRRWIQLNSERALNTIYTNDTLADVDVSLRIANDGSGRVNFAIKVRVDETAEWIDAGYTQLFGGYAGSLKSVVPPGSQYRVTIDGDGTPNISRWNELRIESVVPVVN